MCSCEPKRRGPRRRRDDLAPAAQYSYFFIGPRRLTLADPMRIQATSKAAR